MTGLGGLTAAAVSDACGKRGVLPSEIRHLVGTGPVSGPIVTASCPEGSAAAMLRLLGLAGAGDVLVVQGPGVWGYFGELAGAEAARRGVRAVLVDGLIRDLERLRTLDIHIFARGTTPRGCDPGGPGTTGDPLLIATVEVCPGDHLVGDDDGCVIVPAADVDDVAARARDIEAAEAEVWSRVQRGGELLAEPGQYGDALGDLAGRPQ